MTMDTQVRSARDRIIDLLGIGDTYPLTDLDVVADQLTVVFGGIAKIPIEDTQVNVAYQLHGPDGNSVGEMHDGNGKRLEIATPKVEQNITYRIRATKKLPPGSALQQIARFLNESAAVKVGIDAGLVLELRDLPLLDPSLPTSKPSDPRIARYGQSVDVWVLKSQEEVEYSLVLDGRDEPDVVRTGDLNDIFLRIPTVKEDVIIQVRATKRFPASSSHPTETIILDAKLHLKVMADPSLIVSVEPSSITDHAQNAVIKIAKTQASAKYRTYVRAIADTDFVRGAVADGDVVNIPVAGKPDVKVAKPSPSSVIPEGYVPVGDGPVPGSGGDLRLTVGALMDDTMVIVQALKEHQVNPDAPATIASSIRLAQPAAVLVRPDPARALKLRVPVEGAKSGDTIEVSNGQPGVFYYFQPPPPGAEFLLPAYFHKRDARDAMQNKGVGQLGMEIDFVVAADADAGAVAPGNSPATKFPRLPLLGITPVATGSSLSSRAMKAQTAVEAKMAKSAAIAAVPAIHADKPEIDFGSSAKIVIPASSPQDRYQVMLKGAPVGSAITGDGSEVVVTTDPVRSDAVFEVLVTRLADDGMQVERVVSVAVSVRPAP